MSDSSVWPNLRQGWSRSGVGTQQCERDAVGGVGKRQGKGMLRVWTPRPRSERLQLQSSQELVLRQIKDKVYLD